MLPGWFLEVLELSIPALRAEDQLSQAFAGRIAGATKEGWSTAVRSLQRTARPFEPIMPTIVSSRHAAWFEREGIPYQIMDEEE